jgi:hypothetical protein
MLRLLFIIEPPVAGIYSPWAYAEVLTLS